jgi:hypothetical protein
MLFVDKDVSTSNQAGTLSIVGPSSNMVKDSAETSLEEKKTIMRRGNMAVESWDEGSGGSHLGEERRGLLAELQSV